MARKLPSLSRELDARSIPVVEAVGTVTGRTDDRGELLDSALITRHLDYSLPYRNLFQNGSRQELWPALLDALALWCSVRAFGHSLGPVGLIVAYGLANVAAALPLTPGGLGIVEGILVPTLVALQTTRGIAILGVLTWRLFSFWLPIPIGLACYAPLATHHDKSEPRIV